MGTAIVIGVGPDQGLGAQLCKRFAAEGLNVLVAGRTKAALDAVVADIVAAGGRATAVVAHSGETYVSTTCCSLSYHCLLATETTVTMAWSDSRMNFAAS